MDAKDWGGFGADTVTPAGDPPWPALRRSPGLAIRRFSERFSIGKMPEERGDKRELT